MKHVVFDLESGRITGVDRQPLPFEGVINLPYPIQLAKTIETVVPGMKVQKRNENGKPLYIDNVEVDEDGNLLSYEEVTYSTRDMGDGNVVELYPALIDATVTKAYTFEENPFVFTYEEVVEAKKRSLEANELTHLAYYSEGLDASEFSITLDSHNANMGRGFIVLNEFGTVRTKKINLGESVDRVEVYVEASEDVLVEIGTSATNFFPVEKGVANFPAPASEVYVRFTNTVDRKREIHAFGLLI